MIGLMLMATAWVMREKWSLAAVAIAVATLFKLYPIAFGLLLIVLYPKKMGWRIVACLAIGAVCRLCCSITITFPPSMCSGRISVQRRPREGFKNQLVSRLSHGVANLCWPMNKVQYLIAELTVAAMIAVISFTRPIEAIAKKCAAHRHALARVLLDGCVRPSTESSTYILLAPLMAWVLVLAEAIPSARVARISYGMIFALFSPARSRSTSPAEISFATNYNYSP